MTGAKVRALLTRIASRGILGPIADGSAGDFRGMTARPRSMKFSNAAVTIASTNGPARHHAPERLHDELPASPRLQIAIRTPSRRRLNAKFPAQTPIL